MGGAFDGTTRGERRVASWRPHTLRGKQISTQLLRYRLKRRCLARFSMMPWGASHAAGWA